MAHTVEDELADGLSLDLNAMARYINECLSSTLDPRGRNVFSTSGRNVARVRSKIILHASVFCRSVKVGEHQSSSESDQVQSPSKKFRLRPSSDSVQVQNPSKFRVRPRSSDSVQVQNPSKFRLCPSSQSGRVPGPWPKTLEFGPNPSFTFYRRFLYFVGMVLYFYTMFLYFLGHLWSPRASWLPKYKGFGPGAKILFFGTPGI